MYGVGVHFRSLTSAATYHHDVDVFVVEQQPDVDDAVTVLHRDWLVP